MKNIIGMILAIVSVAGILSACGDGNKSLPRVVECPECSEAQLKVLLGRDASKATSGKNIVLTLQLTETDHDEIVAWISDGGNTPNALCREVVYQAVADHNAFIDTQRWAIVRNNTTLFVDNRQEHGTYLVGGYANIALTDTYPKNAYKVAITNANHAYKSATIKVESVYKSTTTKAESVYKSATAESTQTYESAVAKARSTYNTKIAEPSSTHKSAVTKSESVYKSATTKFTQNHKSATDKARSAYNAALPSHPTLAYNATKSKVVKKFEDTLPKIPSGIAISGIGTGLKVWQGAWVSSQGCRAQKDPEPYCKALGIVESARKKADELFAKDNAVYNAAISKFTPIRDASISKAKAVRDAATSKAKSIRNTTITKANRAHNAAISNAKSIRDTAIAEANRIHDAVTSESASIRDVAINKAKNTRDVAINKAKNIRDAAIAEAKNIYSFKENNELQIEKTRGQHRKTHSALSDAYQQGDIIHVLEQGNADNSLPVNEYRVIAVFDTRLLSHPIALPNGQAANNCNAAPTATGQYYVAESGKHTWQGWR